MIQMLVADTNKLVENLQTEVAVFFFVDDVDCLVDQVITIPRLSEDVWHCAQSVSQSLEWCFNNLFWTLLQAQQNACQYQFLQVFIEYEGLLFPESFANKTQSQDWHFFDQRIFVVDVGTDFFYNSLPLISGNFNAADGRNDVSSSSSDVAIMIDHDWENRVFDGLLGMRLEVVPKVDFRLGLGG